MRVEKNPLAVHCEVCMVWQRCSLDAACVLLRTAPSRSPAVCSSLLDEWADYWEDGLTCVEFDNGDGETHLGVYIKYSMVNSEPHIAGTNLNEV